MSKRLVMAATAVVVVIGLVGVALWYFVLRDTADPEASIAAIDGESAGGEAGPETADGVWAVEPGETVFVGYRVDENFVGETVTVTATGRTSEVEGSVTVEGDSITDASFTADLTQLESDEDRRDAALRTRGLETDEFPEATFELTEAIDLPSEPERGETVELTATGDLTLHGETVSTDVELEGRWDGPTISIAGNAPITFGDFGMEAIDIPGLVSTDDHGTMELQLLLVPA